MTTETYAGNGIRAVAVVLDTVVWIGFGYGITVVTDSTTATGFELTGASAFVWFLSLFAYYILFEAAFGQTVGKYAAGIEVISESGESIDARASLIRNVLRVVDGFLFYLVGAILVSRSENRQRFGDRVGETVVVRTVNGE